MRADSLYREAEIKRNLNTDEYLRDQRELIDQAEALVSQGEDEE
jgi:hypothetical protein